MQKRGFPCGRVLAFALPAILFLAAPSFGAPLHTLDSIRIVPLAGAPRTAKGKISLQPSQGEIYALPGGGWVETGPQDRVLIWLQSQPGCQFLLEPESRLVLHPGRRADAPEYVVAKLERGVLRVPSEGCRTALEVTTSVGRLLSHGARFSVKATDGWISVFHQAGNLQLIFQDQTVPLRTSTVTTISSTGSHRITSFTEADKEPAPANLLPRRPSRGESPAVPNVSPVSASGRP